MMWRSRKGIKLYLVRGNNEKKVADVKAVPVEILSNKRVGSLPVGSFLGFMCLVMPRN